MVFARQLIIVVDACASGIAVQHKIAISMQISPNSCFHKGCH